MALSNSRYRPTLIRITTTTLGSQRPAIQAGHGDADQNAAEDEAQRFEQPREYQQQDDAYADLDQGLTVQLGSSSVCTMGVGLISRYNRATPIRPSISSGKARGPTGS